MTDQELVRINRKLQKMIDQSNVNETEACDLLRRLQEIQITFSILRDTGIGKTVNNLRRITSNKDLSNSAKNLLKNWKILVPATPATSTINDASPPTSIANCNSQKTKQQKNISTKIETTSDTQDPSRIKSRDLLTNALTSSDLPEGSIDPRQIAIRVETAIYDELKDTGMKYGNRMRSRLANLKDKNNPTFRRNVLLGLITPERLAVMTAEEMASDALKEERNRLTTDAINKYQLAVDEGIGTDLIQCPECKEKNCSYTEVQILSADEPMTLFVFCKNCGNRWRM